MTGTDFFADTAGHAPVVLQRVNEREVVAYADGDVAGWIPLVSEAWERIRPLIDAPTGHKGSMRYFQVRPEDLTVWDQAVRHGSGDGYQFAIAWAKDGKIAKNLGIREVEPGLLTAAASSISPSTIAVMVAIANLQASIDRLTEMVEDVAIAIEDLREHFNEQQQSEILAMVETIDTDVYERYLRTGTVAETDWDRIASAEQLFKTQHRAIRLELERLLKYETIEHARHTVRYVTPQRIRNLITLEAFLVRALYRWTTLMLKVREQRGELNTDDVDNAYRRAEDYRVQAQRMVARLREKPTPTRRRRVQHLRTDGLVVGPIKDRRVMKAAADHHAAICASLGPENAFQLPPPPRLSIAPREEIA